MQRLGIAVLAGWLMLGGWWAPTAWAEEPVANNPSGSYTVFKRVVDTLDPQVEEIYDLRSKEWRHGVSAAVYRFSSNEVYLASARVGYAFDQDPTSDSNDTIYGGVKLDVPGIVTRLTPAAVETWVSDYSLLNTVTSLLGKYGAVGIIGGRDLSQAKNVYGFSVGGRVTW